MKIGLTVSILSEKDSIWTNGIKQNVLFLYKMLKNSTENYEVCLLNTSSYDLIKKPKDFLDIEIYQIEEKYQDIDLLIVIGSQVPKKYMEYFKNDQNKRTISYKCGNSYILSAEEILFKPQKEKSDSYEMEFDEVWYVPQQEETNRGFFSTLYRTNSIPVPFIWDYQYLFKSILEIDALHKKGTYLKSHKYDPKVEKKKLVIMEPNLNVVKFCLIPTMIAEESYRTEIGKSKIEKLLISNSTDKLSHKSFLSILSTFDLYRDGKIKSMKRYQISYGLSQYADILLCHQILNPLNYIYLDAAFMGYPVIHNAPMCKDIGYYYEGNDPREGAKVLNWVLENHDSNLKEYAERNIKAIIRYLSNNIQMVKTYDDLIYNIFNGGNSDLTYDPSTNLYTQSSIRNI